MNWKKALDICGIVMAVVFSVVLLAVLVVTPVAATVQRLTVPDNLSDLIGDIDFTEMVKENEGFQQQVEKMGIPAEAINEVMHSDIVGEVTELYEQDLTAVLEGTDRETAFTPQAVIDIFTDNIEEITGFAKQYVPGAAQLDQEKLKKQVQETIEEQGEMVTTFLPPAKDLAATVGVTDTTYGDLTPIQHNIAFIRHTLMPLLYTALGVLTVLLIAVRYYHLRGCLWAGVTFAGSGVVTLLLALGVNGIFAVIDQTVSPEMAGIVAPLSQLFSGGLYPFAIAYIAVGVILLTAFIIATHLFKKAAQPAVPAAE